MRMRNLLPVLLLFFFLYAILTMTDTGTLFTLLKKANPLFLFCASLSSFASLLLFTLSWRFLIVALGERISFKDLFVTFIVGIFSSTINPIGRVGSEGVKLVLLNRKDGISLEKSATSILLKEMVGFFMIASLVVTFFSLIFVSGEGGIFAIYASWGITLMVVGMGACLLAVSRRGGRLLLFFSSPLFDLGKKISQRFQSWEGWMKDFLLKLESSFALARGNRPAVLSSLISGLCGWAFLFATVFLVFLSFNLHLPLFLMCLIVTLAEIASLLPLPAGTGGTDIALTFLYHTAGLPLEASFAAAIVGRFFAFYLPMMTGGILSLFLSLDKTFLT